MIVDHRSVAVIREDIEMLGEALNEDDVSAIIAAARRVCGNIPALLQIEESFRQNERPAS